MSKALRILQLCNKPPLPAIDGGTIAMNNVSEGFMKMGHKVKILTIHTHKHRFDKTKYPDHYLQKTNIEAVFIDTRVNLVDAFSSLVTRDSYNITRFFSTDFDIKLRDILMAETFDVIHLESLFMTPYIKTCKRLSKAKIILRSHNLEYMIWERMAQGELNRPKRAYLKYLAKKLKDYEISILNEVDGVVCISNEDLKKYISLGCDTPLINIPFGVNMEKFDAYNLKEYKPEINLFHIGSMDWSPNLEAVIWFLKEVWPGVNKQFPDLKLKLAGRNMPSDLFDENYPNVIIEGEIDNAYDFMKNNGIMVVPLLSAGGIRVKIIEGMALNKTIISTKIGAEGIDYTDRKNIFIANTSQEFIDAIDRVLKNSSNLEKIGKAAHELVTSKHNNQILMQELTKFYLSV